VKPGGREKIWRRNCGKCGKNVKIKGSEEKRKMLISKG
jgi:hypothetical protein